MIKNLSGGGGIVVAGGTSSYPYVNMNNASAGLVRYNGNSQNLEVYDGSSWMTMSGNFATVELDSDARSLLEWARAKRAEEEHIKKLSQEHPGIRDLKEKLDLMVALVQEEKDKKD